MASAMERLGLRTRYGASQAARVAWYLGHGAALRRLRVAAERIEGVVRERPRPSGPTPGERKLFADMAALFARDLANVEAGLYPMPRDEDGALLRRLSRSRAFFADLPAQHERRKAEAHQEVFTDDWKGRRPRYYLQNFHYQSGGYLSDDSARLYDVQVEVLFNGTANAMRRQALVPIARFMRGRDQRTTTLIDVACGTGRFLGAVKQAYPRMPVLGVDLSESYLAEARRHLRDRARVAFALGNAEQLPLPDASVDIVTTVYLFHELPPKVRRIVTREFARVLKPGGLVVFMDSLQRGDVADYDGLLEMFPVGFHEPYYDGYTREDLPALFGEAGLKPAHQALAFVSKVLAFEKR